jgi:hypothetical protein
MQEMQLEGSVQNDRERVECASAIGGGEIEGERERTDGSDTNASSATESESKIKEAESHQTVLRENS